MFDVRRSAINQSTTLYGYLHWKFNILHEIKNWNFFTMYIYMYTYSFFIISSLEIDICWYFLVKTNQHDRQKYVATWLEIFLSRILFYTNYLSIQSFDFKMIIPWFQFQWYIAVAYVNLWYAVNSKSKLFVEGREQ